MTRDSTAAEELPRYLQPYAQAVQRHGGGFHSLLWASPQSQALRFDAFLRLCDFRGLNVLDAGCGRGDLLDHLASHDQLPAMYTGLEAMEALAVQAEQRRSPTVQIVRGDFVTDPQMLWVAADIVVFCGSLNTLDRRSFYRAVTAGFAAAGRGLLFNFLCSPALAAAPWLTWYSPDQIRLLAGELTGRHTLLNDYLDGDCTAAFWKT